MNLARAIALLLAGLACIDSQARLGEYCINHPAECNCMALTCCLSPGTRCEDDQPCCSGMCNAGLCPGMRLDAGNPSAPAGGSGSDAG